MNLLTKLFAITILFSVVTLAQTDYKTVLVPETAASEAFQTPTGNGWYLSAIKFPDTLYSDMTPMYLMVSETKTGRYDTLKFDDDGTATIYSVAIQDTGVGTVILDFRRIYAFEWWKVQFSAAPGDSMYIMPIFKQFK